MVYEKFHYYIQIKRKNFSDYSSTPVNLSIILNEKTVSEIFTGDEVEYVRADFDIMGKLVDSENIDKQDFLEEYGPLAYRCWKCLEDHIIYQRKLRNFPPFMKYFEQLAGTSYEHWQKQGYNLDETILHHPIFPSKKFDFQQL